MTPIRTLWFGMRCDATAAAMAAASAAVDIAGVIVPAGPRPFSLRRAAGWTAPFDRWAGETGVPVVEMSPDGWGTAVAMAEEVGATVGVGACFPWKVLASVRSALPMGVVNIHPSLLPALRGADPAGEALRLGLATTGVTIHLMDDGWDTGPMLARRELPIPAGAGAATLEVDLFRLGGAMLGPTLDRWRSGSVVPVPQGGLGPR